MLSLVKHNARVRGRFPFEIPAFFLFISVKEMIFCVPWLAVVALFAAMSWTHNPPQWPCILVFDSADNVNPLDQRSFRIRQGFVVSAYITTQPLPPLPN